MLELGLLLAGFAIGLGLGAALVLALRLDRQDPPRP